MSHCCALLQIQNKNFQRAFIWQSYNFSVWHSWKVLGRRRLCLFLKNILTSTGLKLVESKRNQWRLILKYAGLKQNPKVHFLRATKMNYVKQRTTRSKKSLSVIWFICLRRRKLNQECTRKVWLFIRKKNNTALLEQSWNASILQRTLTAVRITQNSECVR